MLELSLNILDLTQNSLTAGGKLIRLALEEDDAFFSFTIEDDGCGMSPDFLARVTDPFTTTRTTRRMGFGLPFIQQLCDMTQGRLTIVSEVGKGTKVHAQMGIDHIDRPPLGDFSGTALSLVIPNAEVDFVIEYTSPNGTYRLDTREVKEILDGMPLTDPDVIGWLQGNVTEGLREVHNKA